MSTIAVAMSGGVDSSTAAALLAQDNSTSQGARGEGRPRVVGLTMQLWNQRRLPALQGLAADASGHARGRCCSLDDVYDARRVASFLGIPYYVVNFQERFEQDVVRPFIESYLAGETPIPCSRCNTEIKFARFVETALEIGAEHIATGHYARLRFDESTSRHRLYAARDRSKDQSYFLFGLTQDQLAHSRFPLGDLTKQEVRAIARQRRLPVAEKPESQEICFVPSGSYRDFIREYAAEQGRAVVDRAGELVSTDGRVLAGHRGVHNFTVGQRKGLGIATGEPLYVIALDPAQNRVVVGPNSELYRRSVLVREVNWIRPVAEGDRLEASVKVRNKHTPAPASVEVIGAGVEGEARVEFVEAQRAVTPGQAAVFYDGEEVVGGGWIASAS